MQAVEVVAETLLALVLLAEVEKAVPLAQMEMQVPPILAEEAAVQC
jgi:hypothetical protein